MHPRIDHSLKQDRMRGIGQMNAIAAVRDRFVSLLRITNIGPKINRLIAEAEKLPGRL